MKDSSPIPLIAHINLAKGFRGGERQTELLIRSLAARGHRQRLIGRRDEPLAARCSDVPGLDIVPGPANVVAGALALRGASLVHVHEARALQAAYLRSLVHTTPYVVTRRCQKGPSRSWLNRTMYRRAARIVVLSDAIGASLNALDPGLHLDKIPDSTSALAADEGRVRELRRSWGRDFIVGHVGALVDSHKGQRQLIAVARHLRASQPDIAFIFVGGGADELAFRKEAGDLDNVHFAGEVADVGNYLAAFDLFAYPSRHEGLGSTLLDAMAFGLPVIATRVGGIPEIVSEGVNGFLCEPDDIAGLMAAVLTLRADGKLRERFAVTNRLKARDYSAEIMADRYLALYETISQKQLK